MIDLKNFDPEQDLKNFLKPYGIKALLEYRKKSIYETQKFLKKQKKILWNLKNFKLQLITITGGTISIFVALQRNADISIFVKLGFASLAISLLCGILSLFFDLDSEQFTLNLEQEFYFFNQKQSLDSIKSFYPINDYDLKREEEMLSMRKKNITELNNFFKNRREKINKILKFIHLNNQKIEDGQIIFFMLGIIMIIIGIFN